MNTNETILKNNQEEQELFDELRGKPKTLATSPSQGTAYTPFDVVAGVTINDLDL